eukprot:TRINITY_DN2036_c0_g4_i2.p1 TRINITY_DN2036_c0_g4~~TRINITY_DN2036_c0_g4_i2.p1  ORF type:complete len:270 (+),score=58.38 TRINITY_DN2036_c0_g4_i2:727-1536(+)
MSTPTRCCAENINWQLLLGTPPAVLRAIQQASSQSDDAFCDDDGEEETLLIPRTLTSSGSGSGSPMRMTRLETSPPPHGTIDIHSVGGLPRPQANKEALYHEQQQLQRCAIHTVNNLLQAGVFSSSDFDDISNSLTPSQYFNMVNPHRSSFGTGNYDVNVIMRALDEQQLSIRWFDRRKEVNDIDFDGVVGLIVNYTYWVILGMMWESKHWFCVRRIGSRWYNLDSNLSKPYRFSSRTELAQYLDQLKQSYKGEVLMVYDSSREGSSES